MSQLTPDDTLLGLIAIRPRHGYDLLETFRDPGQLGEVWKLSTSQLYAVLKRLEADCLIEGAPFETPDAPTRIEYRLTDSGQRRLIGWLHDPRPSPSIRQVRVTFLSRLYIARQLGAPTAAIVAAQKRACMAHLAELEATLERAAPGVGWLTLNLMVEQTRVVLRWLDRCELMPQPSPDTME